jgi:hypothetical protein
MVPVPVTFQVSVTVPGALNPGPLSAQLALPLMVKETIRGPGAAEGLLLGGFLVGVGVEPVPPPARPVPPPARPVPPPVAPPAVAPDAVPVPGEPGTGAIPPVPGLESPSAVPGVPLLGCAHAVADRVSAHAAATSLATRCPVLLRPGLLLMFRR